MKKIIILLFVFVIQTNLHAWRYFPEGTKWTEIRLDTMKYDSWYSKVGDEWVPNYETIEYRVHGEYIDERFNDRYSCIYTTGQEWTDSLTLLIYWLRTPDDDWYGGITVAAFDDDGQLSWPCCGQMYPLSWEVGAIMKSLDIIMAGITGFGDWMWNVYGTVEEIKEGDFGGIRPLKYSDVNGIRFIMGIGVATWNDGECIFGPLKPYDALPMHEERHYRSMLVHFERDGEVLYDVWPEKEAIEVEPVTFTRDQMATIILPTAPDASKGKYYRLDRCEEVEGQMGRQVIFEQELQPRAHVPYIIVPGEDFSIDTSALDLEGLSSDTVSIDGISFIGSYVGKELPDPAGESFYIDIIDTTPDCGFSFSGETGEGAFRIGALRAWLQVTWNDPYNQGGTRVPGEKMQIVLKDNGTGIEGIDNRQQTTDNRDAVYDLSGRKIVNRKSSNRKLQNGIYIEGGRVLIR